MSSPPPSELFEIVARAARESLACFVRLLWPVVNPGVRLVWGQHMDALCDHCEAISHRRIRTAVFNVPPAHSKSTIVSQMWGPWEWLHYPERRWFFVSNSLDNVRKDADFRRQILQSPIYQALVPGFRLRVGARRVMMLRNDRNGSFRALSTGSVIIGDHADCIVMDDPHDSQALSADELAAVCDWHDSVLSTRVRDDAARVLNMQRLAEGDLSDHLVTRGVDAHVCLPALYSKASDPGPSPIWPGDWRATAGELLYPQRCGEAWLAERRLNLGTVGFSAQCLMNPIAGEGNLFVREWWQTHHRLPDGIRAWIAAVDIASAKTADADATVMQVWALGLDNVAYLAEQVSGRWGMPEKLRQAKALSERWPLCRRWMVEQRGEGFAFIDLAKIEMRGCSIGPIMRGVQEPKESRIRGISPHVEAKQVSLPAGAAYTPGIIEEAAKFPRGAHDDQIDCMAYAIREWSAVLQRGASPRPAPVARPPSPARPASVTRSTWRGGGKGLGSH